LVHDGQIKSSKRLVPGSEAAEVAIVQRDPDDLSSRYLLWSFEDLDPNSPWGGRVRIEDFIVSPPQKRKQTS